MTVPFFIRIAGFNEKLDEFTTRHRGESFKLLDKTCIKISYTQDSKVHRPKASSTGPVEKRRNTGKMCLQTFGLLKEGNDGTVYGNCPMIFYDGYRRVIYTYDGTCMHVVASSIEELCNKGLQYPSKTLMVNDSALNFKLDAKKHKDKYTWDRGRLFILLYGL